MKAKRTLCIETDLGELARIHEAVAELGQTESWPSDFAFQVALVLEELIVNIVNYGHDDDASHEIEIALTSAADALTIEIADDGRAFNPLSESLEPNLEIGLEDRPVGGIGLHLVRAMVDDLHYRREHGRNHLTLIKRRNG